MTHYFWKQRTYVGIIMFATMLGALGNPVYAQVNPEIANCEEVKDEATLAQMEACSAHLGCNMVLKIHKACAKAKNFLNKLKTALSGKKEISNEDLFEAGLPELTTSQAMGSKIVAVKRALQESRAGQASEVKIWKNSSGEITHYYEGGVKNNEMDGAGVLIAVQGMRVHGQMKNGRIEGQALVVTRDGAVFVGDYVNNLPNGNVAFQGQNGAVLVGN